MAETQGWEKVDKYEVDGQSPGTVVNVLVRQALKSSCSGLLLTREEDAFVVYLVDKEGSYRPLDPDLRTGGYYYGHVRWYLARKTGAELARKKRCRKIAYFRGERAMVDFHRSAVRIRF